MRTRRGVEAVGGTIRAGGVFCGVEATDGMHALFREEQVAE